jgi:subtilisin family serine protease
VDRQGSLEELLSTGRATWSLVKNGWFVLGRLWPFAPTYRIAAQNILEGRETTCSMVRERYFRPADRNRLNSFIAWIYFFWSNFGRTDTDLYYFKKIFERFFNDIPAPFPDSDSHGTAVAGIIAAEANGFRRVRFNSG